MAHQHLLSNVVSAQVPSMERRVVDTATVRSELLTCIKGTLCCRGDQSFELHSKIFNGDVVIQASVLVRPFDKEDVSQVIKFCQRHSLSLSVKAGGYGTHGQAVQGDIILDVSLLNEISIEKMNADGGFTSIRDMPSSRTASKGREDDEELMPEAAIGPPRTEHACPSISIGKRRADVAFCDTANVSHPMASFLMSGSSFASGSHSLEQGRPISKLPRTDGFLRSIPPSRPFPPTSSSSALEPVGMARQGITGSESGEGSSSSSGSDFLSPHSGLSTTTTAATSVRSQTSKSPPPHPDVVGDLSTHTTSVDSRMGNAPPSRSDPFGYMSDSPLAMPSVPPLPTFDPSSVVAQPFAQPGSSLFSSAGHYMPTRVNPLYPHVYVTFGAGAKQNDVDVYTASHPLPATSIEGTPCFTPYHVPFSAHPVGASVMILGGFGFLSRLHGLSIDNLVEVEMVLADGSIVVVNETEHPDLWWAIRGAGPAFGVVTRYKAKAYPVPVVFAGNLIYKFRRSTAPSLIKHFRDCVKNVPRELYANVILTAGPDGDALLVIQLCYLGTQEQGVEFLQAITSWDGEQCLLNEVSEKSFLSQQESLAQLIRGKPGRKWFIRSDLLSTLTDEMIHETVIRFADTPVGCTWLFELSGGNVSDDHGGCFPASVRQANWTIAAFHQWELDEDDPRCVTTAKDWIKSTLGPASTGGPFPSFFGIHESHQRIKGSFGEHWQRLCQLKSTYDPTGFFTHSFWPLENTADHQQQPKTSLVRTHTEF